MKNFAIIYLVDISEVPDFNAMYELYDPCTVMFFFRNKVGRRWLQNRVLSEVLMIDSCLTPAPRTGGVGTFCVSLRSSCCPTPCTLCTHPVPAPLPCTLHPTFRKGNYPARRLPMSQGQSLCKSEPHPAPLLAPGWPARPAVGSSSAAAGRCSCCPWRCLGAGTARFTVLDTRATLLFSGYAPPLHPPSCSPPAAAAAAGLVLPRLLSCQMHKLMLSTRPAP